MKRKTHRNAINCCIYIVETKNSILKRVSQNVTFLYFDVVFFYRNTCTYYVKENYDTTLTYRCRRKEEKEKYFPWVSRVCRSIGSLYHSLSGKKTVRDYYLLQEKDLFIREVSQWELSQQLGLSERIVMS